MSSRCRMFILMAVVLALALGLAACGSSSSSTSSTPAASGSPVAGETVKAAAEVVPPAVHLKMGDRLKVILHGNPTTGYVWKPSGLNAVTTLRQLGGAVQLKPSSSAMGAPSKTAFTFQAIATGNDQLLFWYARPSDPTNPGAAYALIVDVAKGHVPQVVKAGEDYTAETAQLRTGDTLVVTMRHAATSNGKHSWKTLYGGNLVTAVGGSTYSTAQGGTVTMRYKAKAAGTAALVLVNQPSGDPPLQTYALPLAVTQPKAPITVQVNRHDYNETFHITAGDSVQLTLPAQPSTGYQWVVKKPDPDTLQQAGKPKFKPGTSDTMGAKGHTLWTFKAVGPGQATVRAAYEGPNSGSTGPAKQFRFAVAVKPGFTPKTVAAVDDYPAETVHLLQGDVLKVELAANAGTWKPIVSSTQLAVGSTAVSGGQAVVTYTAKSPGVATQVLQSYASGGWADQAYGFSATIGTANLPKTVTGLERRVAKTIELSVGQTLDVQLPGNPSTGYQWVTDELSPSGILQETGSPSFAATGGVPGSPGTVTVHYKAVGAGSVPLTLLYQPPGSGGTPDGIWMTMVNVK